MEPFEIRADVQISVRGAARLRQGHLWVYAADIEGEDTAVSDPVVRVLDHGGNVAGFAFYSPRSQIRLRLLTRGGEAPDAGLIRRRLESAIARRAPGNPRSASRLVFGEADVLPSIIVDRYGQHLALQTLSRGAEGLKALLVEQLCELLHPDGIVERNDVKARLLEGLDESRGVLHGRVPDRIEIAENGVRFLVDVAAGQKTGFFLDQSENRIAAAKYAHGRALDCFANTGAFALHFAGRCSSVMAVDASADALAKAEANARLNGAANVSFREANVFDLLRELERAGEKFDTVNLDPPAFAKNKAAVSGARAGYKEINLRAMKLMNPEGVLITSSCSYHLSGEEFADLIRDAARDAHRYVQILERRGQAADHPVLAGMPETNYLKCFILRIL